jgi:hypothetical protein
VETVTAPQPSSPGPRVPHLARRLVRFAAVLAAMVVAVVACWHDHAYAHDTVQLTLHSDGRGSIWADVAWEDGHPVSETVAAAISARSQSGQSVGPLPMAPVSRAGTVVYEGTLPSGQWAVRVEAAAPGTGVCSGDFAVSNTGAPSTVTCGRTTKAPAPVAAPRTEDGSGGRTLLFAGIVVVVLVAGAALLVARARTS